MRTLKEAPKFMVYALSRAIRHPMTPVSYRYCPECRQYLLNGEVVCPGCGKKLGNSPQPREISPVPWWGAVLVIVVGISCWVLGSCLNVTGLDEAGRALVYIPLGSLFGMSIPR
jgi:rRNA maturation protein Nop10